MALRWGIASAGKISHDFVTALGTLPREDHEVVAVAARDLARASEFASRHKIPQIYQGYEALAKDKNVDIVYIGSIHPHHYDIAKLMIENKKNVLCEKPLCMNYKQSQQLVTLAGKHNVFLMEAVWSRFFPAYYYLRTCIESGSLGEIYQVIATFGQPLTDVQRMACKDLGGGTILDLGIYVLQFAQMVYGKPKAIVASGHLNHEEVDSSMACVMTYNNGGTATLSTHSKVALPNEATVIGTKGTIKLPNFWCPTKMQLPDGQWKEFPLPKAAHEFNFVNSAGLRYEAEECRKCINQGMNESPLMTWEDSLTLATMEDTIRKQIGVHYDADD